MQKFSLLVFLAFLMGNCSTLGAGTFSHTEISVEKSAGDTQDNGEAATGEIFVQQAKKAREDSDKKLETMPDKTNWRFPGCPSKASEVAVELAHEGAKGGGRFIARITFEDRRNIKPRIVDFISKKENSSSVLAPDGTTKPWKRWSGETIDFIHPQLQVPALAAELKALPKAQVFVEDKGGEKSLTIVSHPSAEYYNVVYFDKDTSYGYSVRLGKKERSVTIFHVCDQNQKAQGSSLAIAETDPIPPFSLERFLTNHSFDKNMTEADAKERGRMLAELAANYAKYSGDYKNSPEYNIRQKILKLIPKP